MISEFQPSTWPAASQIGKIVRIKPAYKFDEGAFGYKPRRTFIFCLAPDEPSWKPQELDDKLEGILQQIDPIKGRINFESFRFGNRFIKLGGLYIHEDGGKKIIETHTTPHLPDLLGIYTQGMEDLIVEAYPFIDYTVVRFYPTQRLTELALEGLRRQTNREKLPTDLDDLTLGIIRKDYYALLQSGQDPFQTPKPFGKNYLTDAIWSSVM